MRKHFKPFRPRGARSAPSDPVRLELPDGLVGFLGGLRGPEEARGLLPALERYVAGGADVVDFIREGGGSR